jgi:hypothetical protein
LLAQYSLALLISLDLPTKSSQEINLHHPTKAMGSYYGDIRFHDLFAIDGEANWMIHAIKQHIETNLVTTPSLKYRAVRIKLREYRRTSVLPQHLQEAVIILVIEMLAEEWEVPLIQRDLLSPDL